MASKLAVRETGYDDERFEQIVSETLHCIICTNVIKDPVMCQRNEHLFCRACITIHLMYSNTCPNCMEPLTVETLRQARTVMNLLSELKIRCEFYKRGCGKFVLLGDLERHVAGCGFAPAVCSNEGCQLEVNKQDLLHHETALCELRRVKCHSCNDMKVSLAAMDERVKGVGETLSKNEKIVTEKFERNETNVKAVGAKVELVQQQLHKQEESNRQLRADNVEIKNSLIEIMKQLERMTKQTSHEVQAEEMKKGIAEGGGTEREEKVIVAGGYADEVSLSSVEMFSLATGTWTQLQPVREGRHGASSVVWNIELFVIGGCKSSVEKLSLNDVQATRAVPWENVRVELPGRLSTHCCVVYNGRLLIIGGFDVDKDTCIDSITEISLVPPYTSKVLANIPHRRCSHGVAIFGDKILIVGGRMSVLSFTCLRSVVMYDITKNECQELAPLPYPVSDMATVKWDDDNVMIMGGADSNNQPLNKILMYNIKTQKSHELPNMKYKRRGCVAAVVRDTVIVMGGRDERGKYLESVEGFRFDRNTWEELPAMHEVRAWATAAVSSV